MDKLTFTVDLNNFDCDDCGNGAKDFIDTVLDRMAIMLLTQRDYLNKDRYDLQEELNLKIESIIKKIENELVKQIEENFKKESIKNIASDVENSIKSQVLKTKSVRELRRELEVENDNLLGSELRSLISDIVVSEVKKMIKL